VHCCLFVFVLCFVGTMMPESLDYLFCTVDDRLLSYRLTAGAV
jgi:hypothetical protein